jgi:hypothetical protein
LGGGRVGRMNVEKIKMQLLLERSKMGTYLATGNTASLQDTSTEEIT